MVDKERYCPKNILMKPLLRFLSCQRQMTTLAIQTGKRFPGESPPCRCKLYKYITIEF